MSQAQTQEITQAKETLIVSELPNSPNDPTTDSLWQITAGPAALAQSTLYDLMKLYLEVMDLDQEQKLKMLDAQSEAAKGQAKATISAGKSQMWGQFSAAGSSLLGAGAGLAAQRIGKSEYTGYQAKAGAAEQELNPMVVTDKAHATLVSDRVAGTSLTDEHQPIIAQMKAGNFSHEDSAKIMHALSVDPSAEKAATYQQIKSQLDMQINRRAETQNVNLRQMNEISTRRQTLGNSMTSLAQGAGNVPQGYMGLEKARKDADAQLDQSTQGLASSQAQGFDTQMSKMFDEAVRVLQALQQLENAGQTR